MNVVRQKNRILIFDILTWYSAPSICAVVALGFYQYFVENLTVSTLLMSLTLFNLLNDPLDNIPQGVYAISEILVAMKRITVTYPLIF